MVDVPPPPENPFMNENGNGNGTTDYANETLDEGAPETSARPGRVLAVVGICGLVFAFLLYNIFSSGDKKEVVKKEGKVAVAEPVEPPPLPSEALIPPPVSAPPIALAAPPVPQPATSLDIIQPKEDAASKQQAMARIKSKMFVDSPSSLDFGSGSSSTSSDTSTAATPGGDPNAAFLNNTANTKAQRVKATNIGDLNRTIAQGRIIQATMESALNTDLPAPIRAIVSRDTYGEAGREPLIPKGSRLIGSYNTDITGAQSRVFVVWTRVIRPDGVDVALGSPLVDQLGSAGVGGQIDTKFQAIFSRSILASVVSITAAIASDEVSGGSTTTATSATGGSSTTGDAATTATVDALNRLGGVSDNFIKRFIDVRPTILVDQGTPVNVFVNRDLVFPSETTGSGGRVLN